MGYCVNDRQITQICAETDSDRNLALTLLADFVAVIQ